MDFDLALWPATCCDHGDGCLVAKKPKHSEVHDRIDPFVDIPARQIGRLQEIGVAPASHIIRTRVCVKVHKHKYVEDRLWEWYLEWPSHMYHWKIQQTE